MPTQLVSFVDIVEDIARSRVPSSPLCDRHEFSLHSELANHLPNKRMSNRCGLSPSPERTDYFSATSGNEDEAETSIKSRSPEVAKLAKTSKQNKSGSAQKSSLSTPSSSPSKHKLSDISKHSSFDTSTNKRKVHKWETNASDDSGNEMEDSRQRTPPRRSSTSKKRHKIKAQGESSIQARGNISEEETSDDGDASQESTPSSRKSILSKKNRLDTPDPKKTKKTKSSSAQSGKRRVNLEDLSDEESSSQSDSPIRPSQSRHYIKPPTFDGKTSFETFYSRFENCAKYNLWNTSDKLFQLKNALTDDAGQVLWDYGSESFNSLSKLITVLKDRFGGSAQADRCKMKLRNRVRQPKETLQDLHKDIRRMMALAHPSLSMDAREILAVDYFMDSLGDPDLVLKIREREP